MSPRTLALLALPLLSLACSNTNPDLPIAPLSPPPFGTWTPTGTAFRRGPAPASLYDKLEIKNAFDTSVLTSEIEGDKPTGTLISPPFTITRDYLSFRIAGGDQEYSTCLSLLINGKVVRTATGRNSDTMFPDSFDLRPYKGQLAQLLLIDESSGDWGHITVSDLHQTNHPHTLPVNSAPLYAESLRPGYHFTARQWAMNRLNPGQRQEGWINDLNGLIYYDGEYHLFAQRWAKCWLHAVSTDLVHWTELPPAFWEESEGSGDQSGTTVVDYNNTSGLGTDPAHPPLIAFWHRFDNRSLCITYSLDHGRSWQHHPNNPIQILPERDPKVFWYTPPDDAKGHWVMIHYGNDAYHISTSPDLLHWTDTKHPIPNSFECPDFFQLPLDGDHSKMQWVLIQGNGNYSLGTFDGQQFKETSPRLPCDIGPNFYATQSWHNTDTGDHRRIQTAWMRDSNFPNMPFSQQLAFPCELTLHSTPAGPRLFRQPVKELASLQGEPRKWPITTLLPGSTQILVQPFYTNGKYFDGPEATYLFRLQADISIAKGATLTLNLSGNTVTLTDSTLESGTKPLPLESPPTHLEILLDKGSIEVFLNHGQVSSTRYALPKSQGISLHAEGGPIVLQSLTLTPLRSSWPATN